MSELKQREQEFEANAVRINGGRKPKFGDLMRNPWASEGNPQRDGYFVRERRQSGTFNPGHYYEFTDKCGKFWETRAKYAFFIDTQPEATKPAQDQQLVVATSTETGFFHVVISLNDGKRTLVLYDKQHSLNGDTVGVADIPAAALASSPADALVAEDRVDAVDAQRYRYIRDTATLDNAVWEALEGYGLTNEAGQLMEDEYRAGMDRAIDRAIQAQKDGHG